MRQGIKFSWHGEGLGRLRPCMARLWSGTLGVLPGVTQALPTTTINSPLFGTSEAAGLTLLLWQGPRTLLTSLKIHLTATVLGQEDISLGPRA